MLVRTLGLVGLIDGELARERRAAPVKLRRRGVSGGELVLALAESQLVGGEYVVFMISPEEYEDHVAAVLALEGWATSVTRMSRDFGANRSSARRATGAAAVRGMQLRGADPVESSPVRTRSASQSSSTDPQACAA